MNKKKRRLHGIETEREREREEDREKCKNKRKSKIRKKAYLIGISYSFR